MNKLLLTVFLISASTMWGHSDEDAYAYVDSLMKIVASSPENYDCIDDENDTNEIEVLFPTMNSLFEYEMPVNSYGYGWTTAEKQEAFDKFLMALGSTNRVSVSRKYKTAYALTLPFCIEKHYTNSISVAKNILETEGSELKEMAIRLLLALQQPTPEMNRIVLSVATNKIIMTPYERSQSVSTYVASLEKMSNTCATVTDAANLMFQNRYEIEHHIAVDRLMLWVDKNYTDSTNRLAFAKGVLALPDASPDDLRYFSSLTNQIMQTLGGRK